MTAFVSWFRGYAIATRMALPPVAAIVSGLLLCACTTVSAPPSTASIGASDSYILIGATDELYQYQLAIAPGDIVDNEFSSRVSFSLAPTYGPAQDGFILVKAEAGKPLGVISLDKMVRDTLIPASSFTPCKSTLVFIPQAGKVEYVGTLNFTDEPTEGYIMPVLKPSIRTDIDSARSFLAKHYPLLSDALVAGQPKSLHRKGAECRPDYPVFR